MKHTPGPWHIGMKPGPMIYGPQGEQIADMRSAMLEVDEHAENARLIAAAPDLLEALKAMHACHRAFSNNDNWTALDDDARRFAESVITKAESGND